MTRNAFRSPQALTLYVCFLLLAFTLTSPVHAATHNPLWSVVTGDPIGDGFRWCCGKLSDLFGV